MRSKKSFDVRTLSRHRTNHVGIRQLRGVGITRTRVGFGLHFLFDQHHVNSDAKVVT
jgi:hypothetical protein